MKILLSPDVAEAASSGTGEDLFEAPAVETPAAGTETPAETAAVETPAAAATATPAASSGLSKDDVEKILSGAMEKVSARAPAAAPAERQYSQDEFDKAFNVLKLSPEFIAQLRNDDPAVAMKALEQYRDGLVRQAMTMAEYRVQALLKEIRDNDLAPIQTFVTEQQGAAFRSEFFKVHPDLEKYEKLVEKVANSLAQTDLRGSRAEMMEHYSTETRKLLAELTAANGTQANGGGNGKATGGQASTARKMSTLTGGGQSTGKGGGAAEAKGPPGIEVFD